MKREFRGRVGFSCVSLFLFAGWLSVSAGGNRAHAQAALREDMMTRRTNSARSVSGQFIVNGTPPTTRVVASDLDKDRDYLRWSPSLAAVSCERIKRALADTLDDNSQWRGKIYLSQYPAESGEDGGTIVAEQFSDGWSYRLELPNPMERTRFTRAIVQALLLERAGRSAGEHAPEIPEWLAAGLTEYLLKANENDLLPPPAQYALNGLMISQVSGDAKRGKVRKNPLTTAHNTLSENPPLTLAELSWPTQEQLDGSGNAAYRSSAQLFVSELLRLKDGRAALRGVLDRLGTCYNWQTAFFQAFQVHFERQVDLEKWWALQLVHFVGRDPSQTWSIAESWNKLDTLLRMSVEVRRARDELPDRGEISLATVIHDWDFIRQSRTLRAKLRELDMLRLRVAQETIGLVDDYRSLLTSYLERRNRAGLIFSGPKSPLAGANGVVRETLRQLAVLEERREELRPQPATVSAFTGEEPAPVQP